MIWLYFTYSTILSESSSRSFFFFLIMRSGSWAAHLSRRQGEPSKMEATNNSNKVWSSWKIWIGEENSSIKRKGNFNINFYFYYFWIWFLLWVRSNYNFNFCIIFIFIFIFIPWLNFILFNTTCKLSKYCSGIFSY